MKTYDKREVREIIGKLINYEETCEGDSRPWFYDYAEVNTAKDIYPAPECSAWGEEIRRDELAELLLRKYNNDEGITLSPEEIEYFLIDTENKVLFPSVLEAFNELEVDMEGVCLDGLYLQGCDFSGLENLRINLDKVENKDLIGTSFTGAIFTGKFDDFCIYNAQFEDCKSEYPLDPQTLRLHSLKDTKLGGIEISGSLDGFDLNGTDFSESKGIIVINPQKYPEKNLYFVDFENCYILGDYDEETGRFYEAHFGGCSIDHSSFTGAKNIPTIDLDDIACYDYYPGMISRTDLTGVRIVGKVIDEEMKKLFERCEIDDEKFTLADTTTFQHLKLIQVDWHTDAYKRPEEEPKKAKRKSLFEIFRKTNKKVD